MNRGTLLFYLLLKSVKENEYNSPADIWDLRKRWMAEVKHPFFGDRTISLKRFNELLSTSPSCHFDIPDLVSSPTASVPSPPDSIEWFEEKLDASVDII